LPAEQKRLRPLLRTVCSRDGAEVTWSGRLSLSQQQYLFAKSRTAERQVPIKAGSSQNRTQIKHKYTCRC